MLLYEQAILFSFPYNTTNSTSECLILTVKNMYMFLQQVYCFNVGENAKYLSNESFSLCTKDIPGIPAVIFVNRSWMSRYHTSTYFTFLY